jgi:putative peptidoglycan lipid II flippase
MSTKKIIRDIGMVTIVLAIARIFGFIREMVINKTVGQGMLNDAYKLASKIPMTLALFLVGQVLTAVFIPIITRFIVEYRKDELNKLVGVLFFVVTAIFIVIIALGYMFAEPLLGNVFSKFATTDTQALQESVRMFYIMLPSLMFMAWSALIAGIHNSYQRFTVPAIGNLIFTAAPVILMLIFPSIYSIAWGITIGAFIQLVIMIPKLFEKGLKFNINFDLKNPNLLTIGSMAIPVLLGSGINYIAPFIERYFASTTGQGSLAAIDNAWQVSQLPLSIFVLAIASVIFPLFAESVAKNRPEALKYNILWSMRLFSFILIPASIGMLVLAEPIIILLFQRGEFTLLDTTRTVAPLAFYSIALLPWAFETILVKVFYSLGDTKTPVWIPLVHVGLLWIFDLYLVRFRLPGLAVGAAASAFISMSLMLFMIRRKIGGFGIASLLVSILKSMVASIIMGAIAYFVSLKLMDLVNRTSNLGRIVQVGFAIVLGITVYIIVMWIIDRQEIKEFLAVLRHRGAA